MKLETLAEVIEGKLVIPDREGFAQSVRAMSGKVVLTIEPFRRKRSSQQNRYYFGVVIEHVREGLLEKGHEYTPIEVHEAMKWKFLRAHEDNVEVPTVRSTTTLTTKEFEDFCENIRRWASEYLGKVIPEPGQEEWL